MTDAKKVETKKAVLFQVAEKERKVLSEILAAIAELRERYTTILNFIIAREDLKGRVSFDAETGTFSTVNNEDDDHA